MTDTRARDRFYLAVAVLLMAASWPLGIEWLQQVSCGVAMVFFVILFFAGTVGS